MARPFTTFSVVDILGPSAPNDAGQLSRPALPSPYLCAPQQPQAYYATHAAIALSHRPGVVNQMLPPVPANNLSPCRAATTASSYSSPTHSPQRPCARSPQRGNNMEKRSQNKRGRKEKRLTPSRVSDEADVSLKPLAENEDDVFLPNFSRRNPARNCQSARDLNSAGDTPSPPGTSANISNDAAPPSPPEESGSTTIATVGDLMTTDMTETDETPEDEDLPKKKRTRTAYSRDQIHTMERHFRKSAYPDNQLLKIIRRETGIEVPKLQVWFQNRRAKARKWGQTFPEPSNNSALYRGVPSSLEQSQYLPPTTQNTTSTPQHITSSFNTSPISHFPTTTPSLIPPSPYHQPPTYPLHSSYPLWQLPTQPIPYPLPYPFFTGGPSIPPSFSPHKASL